ncbi:hypothetical protein PCE1_005016 [Barthelona sp. PCE]
MSEITSHYPYVHHKALTAHSNACIFYNDLIEGELCKLILFYYEDGLRSIDLLATFPEMLNLKINGISDMIFLSFSLENSSARFIIRNRFDSFYVTISDGKLEWSIFELIRPYFFENFFFSDNMSVDQNTMVVNTMLASGSIISTIGFSASFPRLILNLSVFTVYFRDLIVYSTDSRCHMLDLRNDIWYHVVFGEKTMKNMHIAFERTVDDEFSYYFHNYDSTVRHRVTAPLNDVLSGVFPNLERYTTKSSDATGFKFRVCCDDPLVSMQYGREDGQFRIYMVRDGQRIFVHEIDDGYIHVFLCMVENIWFGVPGCIVHCFYQGDEWKHEEFGRQWNKCSMNRFRSGMFVYGLYHDRSVGFFGGAVRLLPVEYGEFVCFMSPSLLCFEIGIVRVSQMKRELSFTKIIEFSDYLTEDQVINREDDDSLKHHFFHFNDGILEFCFYHSSEKRYDFHRFEVIDHRNIEYSISQRYLSDFVQKTRFVDISDKFIDYSKVE